MVKKYVFGTPIETDAVVKEIKETIWNDELFKKEGNVFQYSLKPDEIVYGLGENVRGMNKRGWRYVSNCSDNPNHCEHTNSLYGAHNFIMMGDGVSETYGLFVDTPGTVIFDVGYTDIDRLSIAMENENYKIYLIEGETYQDVVREFREMIGRSYIAPRWAFGYGQSRWSYETADEVREVVREYRKRDIPIDSIYLDIDYMERYKDFTINRDSFADFENLVEEMKKENIHLVPIIDGGVKKEDGYDVYEEGKENGYFCKDENGEDFVIGVWPGKCCFPDMLNDEARRWFGDKYRILIDKGIDGFWNDMNEPASFHGELPSDVVFTDEDQKSTHAAMHNVYGHLMSRATYEGLKEQTGKRPFVITRACYAGSQKYTTVWTGDNQSLWSHLQMAVPQLCNLGLSGLAFAGTDVGGFGADCTAELLCRWVQVGAFSPLFRNHSSNGSIYQEPWQFGEKTVDIYRKFVELRYRLLPYLYDLFAECEKTGLPIMRPLVLHYEKDENTWNLNDEFLVGEHLLVAPVLEQGQTKKMVYLPEGIWYDFNTGKRYEGKQYHLVDAPLDTCPMFAKAGSMIPTYEVMQYVGEKPYDTLNMLVFPGEGTYVHYQDNGSDFAYQGGAYNQYAFTQQENGEVTMKMMKEGYERPYKKIEYIFVGK